MAHQLKAYDYQLPEELIAQYPLPQRDAARLMVIDRKHGSIHHDTFNHLPQYLPPSSCIVLNDSKVIPARLLAKRTSGATVEIFLLKALEDGLTYEVLMRPMKRLKEGEVINLGDGVTACIVNKDKRWVRFNQKDITTYLTQSGHIPLPPYITRPDEALDRKYYQTVYAQHPGSVAAPTAGLHLTEALMDQLQQAHDIVKVTLHINYGTFKAVEATDIRHHHMHSEEYDVTDEALTAIQAAQKEKRAIVAVGTTSGRVLEALGQGAAPKGTTDIFIYPGYPFKLTDILVTNFHLPLSSLLMLVYAFGGIDLMRRAYQEAIQAKYRFYSYGDGMIIL